jgi:uncharacterized membrane protein
MLSRLKNYIYLHKFPVLLLFAILIYTAVLSYLSILRHGLFFTTAWDMGIYEQSIWSTVNTGRFFWYTVELPINPYNCFFGIHFSPALFLVLPLYKVFQSTATLLVLQSSVIALGAVPLYLIALKETKKQGRAFFFSLLYLIYPPLLGVNLFDFHVQAFLPLFFFFAFYYFSNKNFLRYFVFIILALSVIEFVPFIVLFFGLYGLWTGWKEIKRSGGTITRRIFFDKTIAVSILTILLSIVWYIGARSAIFYFNPTVLPNRNWAQLGDPVHNPLGLLWNTLSNPLQTFSIVASSAGEKITYVFGILAPVGFMSLLDLPSLLIGAPWFVAAFLSTYSPYFTAIGYQYVAFVVPFIFVSAVRGVKKLPALRDWLIKRFRRSQPSSGNSRKKLLSYFYVSMIVVSYVLVFYQPHVSFLATELGSRSQQHLIALNKILELVPPNASIMTQNDIFPHVSQRLYAYAMWEFNVSSSSGEIDAVDFFLQNTSPDYILIDTSSEWYLDNIEEYTLRLVENGSYRVYASADYVWLLKKGYSGSVYNPSSNGLSIDLYNQGLIMSVYNSSLPNNVILNETALNVSVSDELLEKLSPYRHDSELIVDWKGWLLAPEGGEYHFYVLSNSSSHGELYIDDEVVLGSHDSTSVRSLSAGFHSLRFEHNLTASNDSMFLFWQPPWETLPKILSSDFLYQSESPAVSSIVSSTAFSFGYRSPFPTVNRDYFSANISGYLNIDDPGVYRFRVKVDNSTLVYVDGSLVFNSYDSYTYPNATNVFDLQLERGMHRIFVLYSEFVGGASLNIMWQPLGRQNFEEIPYSNLFWSLPEAV